MSDKKMEILRQMWIATKEGRIGWSVSDNNQNMFIAQVGGSRVSVRRERTDYFMHVYGKDGSVVETLSDTDLILGAEQEMIVVLKELWTLAKEKATGSGEIMRSILDALQKKT